MMRRDRPTNFATPSQKRARAKARAEAQARYEQRIQDTPQARARRIRSSKAWQLFRRRFMATTPLCADPFRSHHDILILATDVHHIIGLTKAPELAFDPENCAPLCRACHRRIEDQERRGQSTQHLFRLHHQEEPPATPA